MSVPMDRLLDAVEWTATDAAPAADGLPYATHEGVLRMHGIELRVYQLSDGTRVVHAADFEALFTPLLEQPGDVLEP